MDEVAYITTKGTITLGDLIKNPKLSRGEGVISSSAAKVDIPKINVPNTINWSLAQGTLESVGIRVIRTVELPRQFPMVGRPPNMPKSVYRSYLAGGQVMLNWEKLDGGPSSYVTQTRVHYAQQAVFNFLGAMRATRQSQNKTTRSLDKLRDELKNIATTHYLGNASLDGQLGRLLKVHEQAKHALRYTKRLESNLPGWTMAKLVKKYLPTDGSRYRLPQNEDEMLLNKVTARDSGIWVPTLNPTAEAGPPFKPKTKRIDVAAFDLFYYKNICDGGATQPSGWQYFSHLKPKAEVYKMSDAATKIRNIIVYNSAAALPALALTQLFTHCVRPSDRHLIGFNPIGTKAEELIAMFRRNISGFIVFADNCFFYKMTDDVLHFRSMDGNKFEATHQSRTDIHNLVNAMIDKTITKEHQDTPVIKYIRDTVGENYVRNPVIWDKLSFACQGMGSGTPLTFLINHIKMGEVIEVLKQSKLDCTIATDQQVNMAILKTGAVLETTLQTNIVLNQALQVTQEMDLLGYDITYYPPNRKYYLTLNKNRIIKALLFDKTALAHRDYESNIERNSFTLAANLSKLTMLYIMGGWAHKWLGELISGYAEVVAARLRLLVPQLPEPDDDTVEMAKTVDLDIKALAQSVLQGTKKLDQALLDETVFKENRATKRQREQPTEAMNTDDTGVAKKRTKAESMVWE